MRGLIMIYEIKQYNLFWQLFYRSISTDCDDSILKINIYCPITPASELNDVYNCIFDFVRFVWSPLGVVLFYLRIFSVHITLPPKKYKIK